MLCYITYIGEYSPPPPPPVPGSNPLSQSAGFGLGRAFYCNTHPAVSASTCPQQQSWRGMIAPLHEELTEAANVSQFANNFTLVYHVPFKLNYTNFITNSIDKLKCSIGTAN